MKIRLNEDASSIKEAIVQKLPDLELDWSMSKVADKDEKGLPIMVKLFETEVGDFKIIVKENTVMLSLVNESYDGLMEETKTLTDNTKKSNGQRIRSNLYCKLCERFDNDGEIIYYKRILNTLLEKENRDNEDESQDSGDNPLML